MSSNPTHHTEDAANAVRDAAGSFWDDVPDPVALIDSIVFHLDERLSRYKDVSSRDSFLSAALSFSDTFTEYFYILRSHDIRSHRWLWMLVLGRLGTIGAALCISRDSLHGSADVQIASASATLPGILSQLRKYYEIFFRSFRLDRLVEAGPLHQARKCYLACVASALTLCAATRTDSQNAIVLELVARSVLEYYACIAVRPSKVVASAHLVKVELLPILTELARTAFYSGNSNSLLPLIEMSHGLFLVSEKFVPSIILDASVPLNSIIDYYRYFAFCLVSIVVEQDEIDQKLADLASVLFKVLLSIPNLHLSNYMPVVMASSEYTELPDTLVSNAEREQIAFFFLLNYLLGLRTLSALSLPHRDFKNERKYFMASFNKRSTAELDQSASTSSSRASSYVSLLKSTDTNLSALEVDYMNLGAILSDGTYKEKVRLVGDFFKLIGDTETPGAIPFLVQNFDLATLHQRSQWSSESRDTLNTCSRIYNSQHPGKMLVVKAIDKTIRLVMLLSMQMFAKLNRESFDPESFLSEFLRSNYSLAQVLSVKKILSLNEDSLLSLYSRDSIPEIEIVDRNFAILDLTRELKENIQQLS